MKMLYFIFINKKTVPITGITLSCDGDAVEAALIPLCNLSLNFFSLVTLSFTRSICMAAGI